MEEAPIKGPLCASCKSRYMMAALASVGMGIIYGLKVSLHVSIVAMVNRTALEALKSDHETKDGANQSKCGFDDAGGQAAKLEDGPFAWDNRVQGLLLSSYFWTYMIAELPGGRVAELLSAKWLFFFAVALNVVAVLLSPIMSNIHYGALLAMRLLQGIGGGVTFPACHVLIAEWSPPMERSVMSSIVYAGTSLGTVIFMLLSGVIAAQICWEAVFYILGGCSAIWLIFWAWLIADSPSKQTIISAEERAFIKSSLEAEGGAHGSTSVPWKEVFTSSAFLAVLVAHTCNNWGWYMVLIELPQYMKNVLEFDLSKNGVWSSLPFFTMWIFSMIISKILDTLREKGKINTTIARKIATLVSSAVPLVCFVALCFIECNRFTAVALMTIGITAVGGMFCGFLSNHIDIAPNYAGTLVAITNTVASIPGIVVPIVVGTLTEEDPTIHSWRIVFYITIVLYAIEILVFTIFGSGEVQSWNSK